MDKGFTIERLFEDEYYVHFEHNSYRVKYVQNDKCWSWCCLGNKFPVQGYLTFIETIEVLYSLQT